MAQRRYAQVAGVVDAGGWQDWPDGAPSIERLQRALPPSVTPPTSLSSPSVSQARIGGERTNAFRVDFDASGVNELQGVRVYRIDEVTQDGGVDFGDFANWPLVADISAANISSTGAGTLLDQSNIFSWDPGAGQSDWACYQVTAYNEAGESPLVGNYHCNSLVAPGAEEEAPEAPTSTTVTALDHSTLEVDVDATGDGVEVEVIASGDEPDEGDEGWEVMADVHPGDFPIQIGGLAPDTTYWVRPRAYNETVVAVTLFEEDWSGGDFSAWDEGPSEPARWNIVNDPNLAFTGDNVLEVEIPGGQDGGFLNLWNALSEGHEEFYVRMRVRLGSNFGGLCRFFNVRAADPDHQDWPNNALGGAGDCPEGDDLARLGLAGWDADSDPEPAIRWYNYWHGMWQDGDGSCWGRNGPDESNPLAVYEDPPHKAPVDEWFTLEMYVGLNTVGSSDGFGRIWLNGTLVSEWLNEDWRTSPDLLFSIFQVDLRAEHNETRHVYIDDITLMDTAPEGAPVGEPTPDPSEPSERPNDPGLAEVVIHHDWSFVPTSTGQQLSHAGEVGTASFPFGGEGNYTSVSPSPERGAPHGMDHELEIHFYEGHGWHSPGALDLVAASDQPTYRRWYAHWWQNIWGADGKDYENPSNLQRILYLRGGTKDFSGPASNRAHNVCVMNHPRGSDDDCELVGGGGLATQYQLLPSILDWNEVNCSDATAERFSNPGTPHCYVQVGTWYRTEVLIDMGDVDTANGFVHVWLNNDLVIEANNLILRSSNTTDNCWEHTLGMYVIHLAPIYNSPFFEEKTRDDWIYIADFYVTGDPL